MLCRTSTSSCKEGEDTLGRLCISSQQCGGLVQAGAPCQLACGSTRTSAHHLTVQGQDLGQPSLWADRVQALHWLRIQGLCDWQNLSPPAHQHHHFVTSLLYGAASEVCA